MRINIVNDSGKDKPIKVTLTERRLQDGRYD